MGPWLPVMKTPMKEMISMNFSDRKKPTFSALITSFADEAPVSARTRVSTWPLLSYVPSIALQTFFSHITGDPFLTDETLLANKHHISRGSILRLQFLLFPLEIQDFLADRRADIPLTLVTSDARDTNKARSTLDVRSVDFIYSLFCRLYSPEHLWYLSHLFFQFFR